METGMVDDGSGDKQVSTPGQSPGQRAVKWVSLIILILLRMGAWEVELTGRPGYILDNVPADDKLSRY